MKIHRVREVKSTDKNPKPHILVELVPGEWLEVKKLPTHKAIHDFLIKERKTHIYHFTLAQRLFDINVIKNWKEANPIT